MTTVSLTTASSESPHHLRPLACFPTCHPPPDRCSCRTGFMWNLSLLPVLIPLFISSSQHPAEELMNNAGRMYGHRGNSETLLMPSLFNLTSDLFKCTDLLGLVRGESGQSFSSSPLQATGNCTVVLQGALSQSPCSHPTEVHQSSVSAFLDSFNAKLHFFRSPFNWVSLPPPTHIHPLPGIGRPPAKVLQRWVWEAEQVDPWESKNLSTTCKGLGEKGWVAVLSTDGWPCSCIGQKMSQKTALSPTIAIGIPKRAGRDLTHLNQKIWNTNCVSYNTESKQNKIKVMCYVHIEHHVTMTNSVALGLLHQPGKRHCRLPHDPKHGDPDTKRQCPSLLEALPCHHRLPPPSLHYNH